MAPRSKRRHSRRIDISPSVDELDAKRNSEMQLSQCMGEFIDNSIDARSADRPLRIDITIDCGAQSFEVSDNGNGMVSAANAMRSGHHVSSGNEQGSSRYGVGMKDASWRLGPAFIVDSVKDGRRTRATADSEKIKKRRKWVVSERVFRTQKPNGTRVIIPKVDFEGLNNFALTRLRTELEKTYVDAIRAGIQIYVNGIELLAAPRPKLIAEQTFEIQIGSKRCRVRGGTLAPGQSGVQSGVTIRLPFRVICRGERAGFAGYDVSDFYAEVELLEKKDDRSTWFSVSDHKNQIKEKSLICAQVLLLFKSMLKAEKSSHVITIPIPKAPRHQAAQDHIIDDNGEAKASDEAGGVGNKHGRKSDKSEPSEGRESDPPGKSLDDSGDKSAKPKRPRGYTLNIDFHPTSSSIVAEVRCGEKSASVLLGKNNETFASYTEGKDKVGLRDTVAFMAVAAALVSKSGDDPKTPLDILIDQSDKQLDRILRTLDNIVNQSRVKAK